MSLESLIKLPILTRELDIDLTGFGAFIDDELAGSETALPFAEDLDDFLNSGNRLKLHSFPPLYNDLEGFFLDSDGQMRLQEFRRKFRTKFPFLATLDQVVVFFMPVDRQPCAMSCFFLTEVLSKIIEVHGQSKKLVERFSKVERCFKACKMPTGEDSDMSDQMVVLSMPTELFGTLSPTLGKKPVLNLYQRTFDKLQSQYSNLPSFVFLQSTMERIFTQNS